MLTAHFPFQKLGEVTEIAAKFTKVPPYIKKWQSFIAADDKKGIKGYNIIYLEEGKVEEGLLYVTKLQGEFLQVDGYSWKVEPVISNRDGQRIMSMELL